MGSYSNKFYMMIYSTLCSITAYFFRQKIHLVRMRITPHDKMDLVPLSGPTCGNVYTAYSIRSCKHDICMLHYQNTRCYRQILIFFSIQYSKSKDSFQTVTYILQSNMNCCTEEALSVLNSRMKFTIFPTHFKHCCDL